MLMNSKTLRVTLAASEPDAELTEFAEFLRLLGDVTIQTETRTVYLNVYPDKHPLAIAQLQKLADTGYCSWAEIGSGH